MKLEFSTKRLQIDHANTVIIAVVAISSVLTVFSLFGIKALLSQRAYQARVITQKEKAKKTLKANLTAVDKLVTSYQTFQSEPQNLLGGNPAGSGDKDGDNAKLVLDALPSKYDFPALASSLEKLLTDRQYKISGISGTDEELAQKLNSSKSTGNPKPIDMPFEFGVDVNYASLREMFDVFHRSIRPFHITSISLAGSDSDLHAKISAKTFYLPEKGVSITTKVVK